MVSRGLEEELGGGGGGGTVLVDVVWLALVTSAAWREPYKRESEETGETVKVNLFLLKFFELSQSLIALYRQRC